MRAWLELTGMLLATVPAHAQTNWTVAGRGDQCIMVQEVGDTSVVAVFYSLSTRLTSFHFDGPGLRGKPLGKPANVSVLLYDDEASDGQRFDLEGTVTQGKKRRDTAGIMVEPGENLLSALGRYRYVEVHVDGLDYMLLQMDGGADALKRFRTCRAQMRGETIVAY